MFRTVQYHIKKGNRLYSYCDEICYKSSKLYNSTKYIYSNYADAFKDLASNEEPKEIAKSVFDYVKSLTLDTDHEPKTKWLTYGTLDYIFKTSKNHSYYALYSQANQQIIKQVINDYSNYFKALKVYFKMPHLFAGQPEPPGFKRRPSTAFLTNQICTIKNDKYLKLPGTKDRLNLRKIPDGMRLKQVTISPFADLYNINVVYESLDGTVKELGDEELIETLKPTEDLNGLRILGIDPGLNNFCSVVNNFGETPFLVNGKIMKCVNAYYNKNVSNLKSQAKKCNSLHDTKRIKIWQRKRYWKIKDSMHKISKYIADYANENQVDYVIMGHNKMQKQNSDMGTQNNQNFVQIPYLTFCNMLRYKLENYGIRLILTEESYTSDCDFCSMDFLPKYEYGKNKEYQFSGKRIKRGLYRHGDGKTGNADLNGAANIVRKVFPNIKEWDIGVVDTPYVVTIA